MDAKQKVFISYSHDDREWLDMLKPFLRPFEREADLEVWSDQNIKVSSDWHGDIQKAVNEADAAILLISQRFLASDYVANNELPVLLSAASERGLRILPVYVSTAYMKGSPLLRFQAVNAPTSPLDLLEKPKQKEVLARLAESIGDLLETARLGVTEEWLERFRRRFARVEGGDYCMGDNDLFNKFHALAEHQVHVASFSIGRYVVTQSEWTALMNTRPWMNQKNVRYGDEIPAVYVSWYDALDFVRALNKVDCQFAYRLPTEAEWEYAARGGQAVLAGARAKFSFGDDTNKLLDYGWYDQNASLRGDNYAHAVGMLQPNQLGIFDMHGNIWEWISDDVDGLRVLRGGGFNFMADGSASAFRVVQKPETKGEAAGFRLVQEAKP